MIKRIQTDYQKHIASITHTGKKVSLKTRKKQRKSRLRFISKNPVLSKEYSSRAAIKLKGKKHTHKVILAQKKRWENIGYKNKQLKKMFKSFHTKKPNQLENKLIKIIKKNNIPFKFVGNRKLWLYGYNPDFIGINNKLIIEVYGNYWHNRIDWKKRDEKRINILNQNGYKTLIFWESEITGFKRDAPTMNELEIVNKINLFINNP
jgi:very-short-patch-repair endonuclease